MCDTCSRGYMHMFVTGNEALTRGDVLVLAKPCPTCGTMMRTQHETDAPTWFCDLCGYQAG
jgi:ribosomal protein S27AE